ncbi:hypothetical protein BHE74_00008433 [Ensete ventricosum]|nr:hypothetical protein BHE74_00008433 [Ensete ventricosum]
MSSLVPSSSDFSSCSSPPAASWLHPPEKKRCVTECRGIPEQQQRKKLCMRRCLDHSGEQEAGREHNPYYFDRRSYHQWSRTEHRRLEVLERFARRSNHLLGVDNYRLAVLEAEPQTFIMP